MPLENLKLSNIDLSLILRVNSVKMRWRVIWSEYSDNYAVEATEFRHELTLGGCHQQSCLSPACKPNPHTYPRRLCRPNLLPGTT